MGAVFAYGLLFAISIGIGLIMLIISLFVGHIILFDSIFLALISGICYNKFLYFHPALAFLAGLAVFFLLFWLQNTKAGFWIIGIALSVLWAFIFAFCTYAWTSGNMTWTYVIWGIGILIMIGLHLKARNTV